MHNQLYDYFKDLGAQWSPRPFQITLAKKVRWKTVKHMNRYFAHAERVIDAWREKGPQYCNPQLSYIEGGATPEEVARPHGIYLLRDGGVPTNYFAPNFAPPYTTKMTRSLLLNVLSKSWNAKRREWTSQPVPRLVTPTMLVATMCGCGADPNEGGFMANQVTTTSITDKEDSNLGMTTPKRATAIPDLKGRNDDDDDEEEYAQIVNVSMSNKSGESTILSSVLLTPYEDEEGIPKPDPVAQLGTTLEDDLSLDDDDDDDWLEEDMIKEEAPRLEVNLSLERANSGRYGQSPTPEMGNRLPRSPTPESGRSFPRSLTPESARIRSRSPPVSPMNDLMSPVNGGTTAPSEFGSTTTVQHMNSTSEKLMQREEERKKLREQTKEGLTADGIDELSSTSENMTPKVRWNFCNGNVQCVFS
jgi:hypothetical protein